MVAKSILWGHTFCGPGACMEEKEEPDVGPEQRVTAPKNCCLSTVTLSGSVVWCGQQNVDYIL